MKIKWWELESNLNEYCQTKEKIKPNEQNKKIIIMNYRHNDEK